jgi:hypothetical protein
MNIKISEKDIKNLIQSLLPQKWQRDCYFEIKNTEVKIVHQYQDSKTYLRYSCGPDTSTFWDCYGNDFHNISLAIIALSNAPLPHTYVKLDTLPIKSIDIEITKYYELPITEGLIIVDKKFFKKD